MKNEEKIIDKEFIEEELKDLLTEKDSYYYYNTRHLELVKIFVLSQIKEALKADRENFIKEVEEIAYVPDLKENERWTGKPTEVVDKHELIKILKN